MEKVLKILILEDSLPDAEFIQRVLLRGKINCEFKLAMNKESFLNAIDAFIPDIILSDNSLPQFNAMEALKLARLKLLHIPFILVTGTVSEEFAATIIKSGADDYILKDRMTRLPVAIIAAVKQRRTEKEKLETLEQLKENEKKYRDMVERISDGFVSFDINWCFTYLNKKAEEFFIRPPGYLIGKNIWSEYPKAKFEVFYTAYFLAMETQKNSSIKAYSPALERWIETHIYPSLTGISIYFRDITEQKQNEENLAVLEAEIFEQKIQEQKKIARAIIIAQEKERNHIGQELHDNINQILTASKIYLSHAGNKNETIMELIKYPIELIEGSIREIRVLCGNLVTPVKDINLEEMVKGLLSYFHKTTHAKTDFIYLIKKEQLSDDLKLNIYRVIQEQINNILKHAEASKVSIHIKEEFETIRILVADNGKGFDPSCRREGIGLSNMINRIESFNGKINIQSAPGNGCQIETIIPS